MAFNLSQYKTQATGKIQLSFDGEDIEGAAVILHGQITKEYQDAVKTYLADQKDVENNTEFTDEQREAASFDLQTRLLVALTQEMQGVEIDDIPVGNSKDLLSQIYGDKGYSWLRAQLLSGVFSAKTFLAEKPAKKPKKS